MPLPPGPNVGTQLRALRAKQARERKKQLNAPQLTTDAQQAAQLALPSAEGWFAAQGWTPFAFQREVWEHIAAGRSGLLHATTGAGKTYAVWLGFLSRGLSEGRANQGGLRLLWVTPMRALSADTARALQAPLAQLGLDWTVGVRTGDTDSAERARQAKRLPEVLVTTPESLSLLLTRPDCNELFAGLQMVVVDEWHELIGSKRGVQVQLALARLRALRDAAGPHPSPPPPWRGRELERAAQTLPPASAGEEAEACTANSLPCASGGGLGWGHSNAPIVWSLSATLGNLDHALHALIPANTGVLVRGRIDKHIIVDTLLPHDPGRFPWGGHLGIQMLEPVLREIERSGTTIIFTNVRSQAEIWYQSILQAKPQWAGLIALHHGSLDKDVRDWVELGLKDGRLKAVVATSSLDLGVDFLPVERVLQVGSAKGVARLLQRAGRSGHAPGRASRVTLVPTSALELIEAAAAKKAAEAGVRDGKVEQRTVPSKPLDVLVQHIVTVAMGAGFTEDALLAEVRSTASYCDLTDDEWRWALDFAGRGGESLRVYPEYRRVVQDAAGIFRVPDARIARRHRMSVGTIVSDAAMLVRYQNGTKLGSIEESFVARLHKGDVFTFGGKLLELVRVQDMTAYVTPAKRKSGIVPRWGGTKLPLSGEMADAVLQELEAALAGRYDSPELQLTRPLIELQAKWSAVPTRAQLVVESYKSREGRHLFVYPFAGRHAHLGLASLIAFRVGRTQPATFSISVNDYGFELLAPQDIDWRSVWCSDNGALLSEDGLLDDIVASLNAGELAQRRFREIARVSGLIFQGYPGQPKSMRQLQASSQLLYEVFRKYDAGNLLLSQAEREVLEQELELGRLRSGLARMRAQQVVYRHLMRPTPLAFPLMVERFREQLTTEKLADRIARMIEELENAA